MKIFAVRKKMHLISLQGMITKFNLFYREKIIKNTVV